MSEKLKYVLTLNHPGRNKCTRASLWETYRDFIGSYADLWGFIGTNRIKDLWRLMETYGGVLSKYSGLIGLLSL